MTQRIGLIGLHQLEAVVSTLGLTPVTDPKARDSAMKVHSEFQNHGRFPVLILMGEEVLMLPSKMATAMKIAVLLKPGDDNPDPDPTYPVLQLPVSLTDALNAVGVSVETDVLLDEDGEPYEPMMVAPEPSVPESAPSAGSLDWNTAPNVQASPDPAPEQQVITPVPAPAPTQAWTPPVPASQPTPAQAYTHAEPQRQVEPPMPVSPEARPAPQPQWTPPASQPSAPVAPQWTAPTSQPSAPAPQPWTPPPGYPASQPSAPAPQPWTPPVQDYPPQYPASQVSAPAYADPRPAAPAFRPEAPQDIFGASPSPITHAGSYRRPGLGELVFTLSGKGGVGKSTTSIALAHRAAQRGLRAILVDGNFGQGDDATFLIPNPQVEIPTVYDFTVNGSLRDSLITPAKLNSLRNAKATPLGFGLVCAPNDTEILRGGVTPRTYADLIAQAREMADIVVVDTQIVEADDPRGMVTKLVVPELQAGAWGVVIADLSKAGIANLMARIKRFQVDGANPAHLLSMLNRVPLESSYNPERLKQELDRISIYLGTIYHEPQVQELMNRGHMVSELPVFAHILDQVLYRTSGLEIIAAPYRPDEVEPEKKKPWWKLW